MTRFQWRTGAVYRSYDYTYDDLGRVTRGNYADTTPGGTGTYDLAASYDLHGNLQALQRRDASGWMDDLTYHYTGAGNQLTNVLDATGRSGGFAPDGAFGSAADVAYTYDRNGNLLADRHKGLSVAYNYLNVPSEIDFGGGKRIRWLWTATGEKLRRTTLDAEGATETKRYAGGFTYRDADGSGANEEALDHFGHAGGRVRYYESGDQLAYQYAFSDHLGNTRVLAEPDGQGIVQETSYYPYGLQIADLGGGSSTNEELYNGKELTDSHGLDWYLYGARYYDVEIARWTTMDPADEFHSPYVYVGGDPVNLVDPDGRQSIWATFPTGGLEDTALFTAWMFGDDEAGNQWKKRQKIRFTALGLAATAVVTGPTTIANALRGVAWGGGLSGAVSAAEQAYHHGTDIGAYNYRSIAGDFVQGSMFGASFSSASGFLNAFRAVPANVLGGMANRSINGETALRQSAITDDISSGIVSVGVGYPLSYTMREVGAGAIVERTVTKAGTSVTNLTRQGFQEAINAPPLGKNSDHSNR